MKYLLVVLFFLYTQGLSFSKDDNRELVLLNQEGTILKTYPIKELLKKFKKTKVSVYNYTIQEIEVYWALDLGKILDKVYGRNKWRNSYAIGTITTDKYAPLIKNHVHQSMRPYLAFDRADGKDFVIKKSFSKGYIDLSPFYIIWKIPKKMGNLKKVRDHWPWKITSIYLYEREPKELIPSTPKLNDGKETFTNHCIACHAINGVGGKKGEDLKDIFKSKKMDDKYLQQYILNPRLIKPNSRMPHFPIYLDDKENRIKRLIKYIKDRVL